MIAIDRQRCSGCGFCVRICHEHCIELQGGIPVFRTAVCSTCTQCVAACPTQALTWDGAPPRRKDTSLLPSTAQLDELFLERRSVRFFKRQGIDRALLAEIVDRAVYAPKENFRLRAIVVDDRALIEAMDRAMLRVTRRIYNLLYRSGRLTVLRALARLVGKEHVLMRHAPKLEAAVRRGTAWPTLPAAVVLIVGLKGIPLSRDSAQFALANLMYAAQVRGLGCCLCGNGPLFLDKNKSIRATLAVQQGEDILGALVLGHPAVRFANVLSGRAMPLQWNGGTTT